MGMMGLGKIVFLATFFAFLIQSLVFFGDNADELIATPLALCLAGAAAYYLSKDSKDQDADFQLDIFLWAFSVRLMASMVFYGWDLTEFFGDEDASGYVSAWTYVNNWYENGFEGLVSDIVFVFFGRQNIGQGFIWAFPALLTGEPSRLVISITNAFFGSLLVVVIFRMTRRLFNSEIGKIAAVIATFWTAHIFFSIWTSKEILVIFSEWTVLYLIIRSVSGFKVTDGLAAIPFIMSIFIMRFYAVYMIIAAFMFRMLTAGGKNMLRNILFGSMVLGSIIIVLIAGGAINRDFERFERQQEIMEDWRTAVADTTGSGVNVYTEYESPTLALPVAAVYFFLAPFPWQALSGSGRNAFGALENLVVIVIIILGFPALKIFFKNKFFELLPIFIFCGLYAAMHIWALSNIGLAWRHKQTVMPMFFMLVAVGITQRKAGWQLITGTFGKKKQPEINRALNR